VTSRPQANLEVALNVMPSPFEGCTVQQSASSNHTRRVTAWHVRSDIPVMYRFIELGTRLLIRPRAVAVAHGSIDNSLNTVSAVASSSVSLALFLAPLECSI
jgi:hypothetical protein